MMIFVRTGRRSAVALAAIALIATALTLPASATAASPHLRLQTAWAKYSFDGTRGSMSVRGSVKVAPGAFFAVATVFDPNSSKPDGAFADVFDLNPSSASTYGSLGNRDLCAGPIRCTVSNGTFRFGDEASMHLSGKPLGVAQYIVVRGADVRIHDTDLDGWTAQHESGGVIRVTEDQAAGAGLRDFGYSAGFNTGASAPGSWNDGSVAIAVPACDEAGAGVLSLRGGVQQQNAICPTGPVVAVALERTTWVASGAVTGMSTNSTRMLVLRR